MIGFIIMGIIISIFFGYFICAVMDAGTISDLYTNNTQLTIENASLKNDLDFYRKENQELRNNKLIDISSNNN